MSSIKLILFTITLVSHMVKIKLNSISVKNDNISTSSIKGPLLVEGLDNTDVKYLMKRNKQSRKSHQLVLTGESDLSIYEAKNFGSNDCLDSTNPSYRYAVILLDEQNLTGQIYDAQLLKGKKTLKKYILHQEDPSSIKEKNMSTRGNYRADMLSLSESFGTRKIKKAIKNAEKNHINVQELENNSSELITKAIDSKMEKNPEKNLLNESSINLLLPESELLPAHYPNAQKPELVYPLEVVIPESLFDILNFDLSEKEDICQYVKSRYENLNQDKNFALRRVQLNFINFAIKFGLLHESRLNLDNPIPGTPSKLLDYLYATFTESFLMENGITRYRKPLAKKDKLIIRICCVALWLDKFNTNITELSLCLKISVNSLSKCFRTLGCTLNNPLKEMFLNKPVKRALLTIPLSFPKIRKMKNF